MLPVWGNSVLANRVIPPGTGVALEALSNGGRMYPGIAPDPKSPVVIVPPPWAPGSLEPQRTRRGLPPAPGHEQALATGYDPALLLAALEAVQRRDDTLAWLLEEGLLGVSLAG